MGKALLLGADAKRDVDYFPGTVAKTGKHDLANHKGRGQELQSRCNLAISYLATSFVNDHPPVANFH